MAILMNEDATGAVSVPRRFMRVRNYRYTGLYSSPPFVYCESDVRVLALKVFIYERDTARGFLPSLQEVMEETKAIAFGDIRSVADSIGAGLI